MTNTIEKTILKLRNRYEVQGQVTEVKRGYRIGVGKIVEVYLKEASVQIYSSIVEDAKPFLVWFYSPD